jgi:hypothetical protein
VYADEVGEPMADMQRVANHGLLRALFAPVETGTAHRLTVEEACTVVVVGPERKFAAADPRVVERLLWLHENDARETYAVVLRSYTGERVTYSPGSDGVLAQRIRGWVIVEGEWKAVTASQLFNAMCTDPDTDEPIPPEPATEYLDAWPVLPPQRSG